MLTEVTIMPVKRLRSGLTLVVVAQKILFNLNDI